MDDYFTKLRISVCVLTGIWVLAAFTPWLAGWRVLRWRAMAGICVSSHMFVGLVFFLIAGIYYVAATYLCYPVEPQWPLRVLGLAIVTQSVVQSYLIYRKLLSAGS